MDFYFRYFHAEYPLLHRPTFELMTDALYLCAANPEDASILFNGWHSSQDYFPCNGERPNRDQRTRYYSLSVFSAAAQLLLVLSIASKLKMQKRDYQHHPEKYIRAATSMMDAAVSAVSVPALQIIILLVLHSFTSSHSSNTWITVHLGMALAIDLGLHRDIPDSRRFSPLAL